MRRIATRIALRRTPVIGVAFSVGTAFLGATLGVVPDLLNDGLGVGRVAFTGAAGLVGAACVAIGYRLWKERYSVLRRRGTAYVVQEDARGWTPEYRDGFLAELNDGFLKVLRVPGPRALTAGWEWPLDGRATQWSERTDELVRAFWTTHSNDELDTPNALFIWAWWPVAFAFAARASAGRRGLRLHIRQRPSEGRGGSRLPVNLHVDGHDFRGPGSPAEPSVDGETPTWSTTLHVERTLLGDDAAAKPESRSEGGAREVLVLLIRLKTDRWGPLPATFATSTDPLEPLTVLDTAGLGLPTDRPVTIHEWRHLHTGPATHRPPGDLPWDHFPAVARSICTWIEDIAARHPKSVLLLGTVMPQELGFGLGILSLNASAWPENLWPLVYDGARKSFTIPRLNLGGSA